MERAGGAAWGHSSDVGTQSSPVLGERGRERLVGTAEVVAVKVCLFGDLVDADDELIDIGHGRR
jgi:hypothetical protein